MYKEVTLNKYGFYTLRSLPSDEEREAYYRNQYYQKDTRSFQVQYTREELSFFKAKLEQKLLLIQEYYAIPTPQNMCSLIDIGCGEGFAVAFFKEQGFSVLGLDYSDAGVKNHNSHISEDVIVGDVYGSINRLIQEGRTFDIVNMDNILEHVTDPESLLGQVFLLLKKKGIAIIKVPNDFSVLQQYFFDSGIISKPHWVAPLDHISYFNRDGLISICQASGLEVLDILGNYMTEFFILNPHTNYLEDVSKGKSCHLARVAEENIFHSISPSKTIKLYRILGEMGLGREIIGIFEKKEVT